MGVVFSILGLGVLYVYYAKLANNSTSAVLECANESSNDEHPGTTSI
jgi:hypothetical protein